ncbi:TlpA family protein disulfide reductase [bacterium]|nr:MAG: TlpA family protein disulfide reductase [bacterium]
MIHVRPLLLCVALAASALAAGQSPGIAAAPPHRDAPAPVFTLPLAGGHGTISLAALRGHPVYLNYFASWCPPCNAEAPSLAKLAAAFKPKGLVVIGIDELEGAKQALSFSRKYRLPYGVALDGDGTIGAAYGVSALPVHVFIDRDGRVVFYQPGEMDAAQIERHIEAIVKK